MMFRFHLHIVWPIIGAFCIVFGQAGAMSGDDFRVENTVYQGDEKTPSCTSTTIFHGGMVYDCMKTPAETVVFDKTADRFILLNLNRRLRAELTTTQLADFIDRLQMLGAKNKDPVVQFLAEPKFQERFDETTNELTLASPSVTYRLVLAPESNRNLVEQYHEFCDYYARLNALLTPGSRPPFGRLVVNAAIAQHQATASRVLLTIISGQGAKRQQTDVRSEHRVVSPLEPADLEQVKRTHEQMGSFKLVGFNQYRKTDVR